MTQSIYAKLSDAREEFHALELKKTGHNTFANYRYFELGDFLIPALRVLKNHGLVTTPVSFGAESAEMAVIDIDTGDSIALSTPMSTASLKACHPVQNLGAVQTYLRRYLWVNLMEIVEHDSVDSAKPIERVTAEQAANLRDRLEACGGDEHAFCKWLKISALEELPTQALESAEHAISRKEKA
jgi:hypothetical protein